MYTINVSVTGITPLLMHNFAKNNLDNLLANSRKRTGSIDYSLEWLETAYITADGFLFQPATHIEGAMVKAASRFSIPGQGKRTWKDPVKAYVYICPDQIVHLQNGEPVPMPMPELLLQPTPFMSVSIMRVVIQRAAVARHRLQLSSGWNLQFQIEVHDEQVEASALKTILDEAGRAVGIGDYRPRYGRFVVNHFEVG